MRAEKNPPDVLSSPSLFAVVVMPLALVWPFAATPKKGQMNMALWHPHSNGRKREQCYHATLTAGGGTFDLGLNSCHLSYIPLGIRIDICFGESTLIRMLSAQGRLLEYRILFGRHGSTSSKHHKPETQGSAHARPQDSHGR